ncbi:ubl carboxyl-terminal hydrolase 18 isoform X2 [Austrofundulus limnaeus]|uniref:Ubl carboxyl-terminal hydrolase 18 isoform X2 n=1 Tax=Austrofundulus limnaeus TaxID=52670 RepID=A0A2I4AW42_AUSLI|nr:PREDICTED: ubl carboxyl-terminal hydrolase 18-like isoform X2 [Austrofundulus limnaeus]
MSAGSCSYYSKLWLRNSQFGMRGLTNYSLSCCVNSLLQTLSATWELADILEKWATADLKLDGRNVPLQLKKVLAAMRSDLPQPAPHRDFLNCLDRNYIRLNIQHDADEVFLSILNLLQQQVNDKDLALEIQNLYKISVETQLQCLECNTVQTRSTYLVSLPLHIKEDHNSLENCMVSFFEHQELKGANSCFCSRCGTRTPSRQGVKLHSLPQILCIQLKRFRNTSGSTRKLDCTVTFPETFNFSTFLQDAFSANFSQGDCRYSLYAVVVHCGCAGSGHYTAYVRNRLSEQWYYADDSHVQQCCWKDVEETYGGRYRHRD